MAMLLLQLLVIACTASASLMTFGPPIPVSGVDGGGGKMSNTLDLYPDGFASNKWASVDGGQTFQRFSDQFNVTRNTTWTSFAMYTNATTGRRWAHCFGTSGEALEAAGRTSFSSKYSFRYEFEPGTPHKLVRSLSLPVTFSGLPYPICKNKGVFTPYASGHIVFADGLHLQTGMYLTCAPSPDQHVIAAFTSIDGYHYDFLSNVATSKDVPTSSEGPNEHDIALLPNGDVMVVFRTGAGDGRGQYEPYYMVKSTDRGKSWSTPVPLRDTSGNYIGCARPHLVQLGSVTLLSGGRMMMGHDYSRSFSIWMSEDAGATWVRADGSYHHNAKASMTKARQWPASCNRTGWRFEFTTGYVGLVRVAEDAAAVLYDLMLPPLPPSPSPAGPCKIHVHHTVGCFNISDWKSGAAGPVLPSYQPSVRGKMSMEACGAACHAANLTIAGVEGGSQCFCGSATDMGTPSAKARSLPKQVCELIPCDGKQAEKGCGGNGTMLAYEFTCDESTVNVPTVQAEAELGVKHDPPTSYSMRITVSEPEQFV